MGKENAVIVGVFITEEIGLTNPARTPSALAPYTCSGLEPHALHASLLGREQLASTISGLRPSVVGINIATSEELSCLASSVYDIKNELPSAIVIVGGFYPSLFLDKKSR